MNQVRNIQRLNDDEISRDLTEKASWHDQYRDSSYIFVGGLAFELSEGDLLSVFSQYGEIVNVHLIRDKLTGKSKGFAFLQYQDQRSTILAVDNLNGIKILNRVIRVDHALNYKEDGQEDRKNKKQTKISEMSEDIFQNAVGAIIETPISRLENVVQQNLEDAVIDAELEEKRRRKRERRERETSEERRIRKSKAKTK